MGSYTTQQNAFVFSLVSNAASAVSSNFAAAITQKFGEVTSGQYSSFIGTGWSIAWGPVVVSEKGDVTPEADNTLMVVQGTDASGNPLYIVPTAGANPKSLFDELAEDLSLKMVAFPGGGNITTGTNDGLTNLLGMSYENNTLQQFLDSVPNAGDATLVFTGHSLGGALTPALALSIDTSRWGQVYAMPTAGPTTGDAGFAAAFTKKFPTPQSTSDPRSTWNCNIVNESDLVPMVWNSVGNILGLYSQLGPPSPCVTAVIHHVEGLIPAGASFVSVPQVTFTADFVPQPGPFPYEKNPTVLFFAEALYQHIAAYTLELVPDLLDAFPGMQLTGLQYTEILTVLSTISPSCLLPPLATA